MLLAIVWVTGQRGNYAVEVGPPGLMQRRQEQPTSTRGKGSVGAAAIGLYMALPNNI